MKSKRAARNGLALQAEHQPDELADARSGLRNLFVVVSAAVGLAAVLWWIGGWPHLPSSAPDWERTQRILQGSDLPYHDVVYVTTSLGWLLLIYLGLSTALRLLVSLAIAVTHGAGWARAVLQVSNLITVPLVRRVVDAAVAGALLLAAWLPTAARLRAEDTALQPTSAVVAALPNQDQPAGASEGPDEAGPIADRVAANDPRRFVSYTVVSGDTLWDIARRFYGDGSLYPRIFEANCGRTMVTGEAFTNPRLIRPGWVLDIPLPTRNLAMAGEGVTYVVQRGDSLWAIAARFLGSGLRWPEIWELNGDREMNDGRRFRDADLIYPGWVLELPIGTTPAAQTPESSEPPPTSPSPAGVRPVEPPAQPGPTVAAPGPSDEEGRPASGGNGGWGWMPSVTTVVLAGAGAAAAGATALAVGAAVRRNGAAPLRMGRGGGRRGTTGDVGKVLMAARSVMQALADLGFVDLGLVLARESENSIEFAIDCAPGDAQALVGQRYAVGRRLACGVEGTVEGARRARLTLSRFRRLAGLLATDGERRDSVLLVPVGANEDGVWYINLAAVGSALIAGSEQETSGLLASWVATLAATHPPEHLAFVPTDEARARLGDLASLPHTRMVSEGETLSLEDLAKELEDTVVARGASDDDRQGAALLPLAVLSADVDAQLERLEVALRRGAESRIYPIAVAQQLPPEALERFGARVTFGGGSVETESAGVDAPVPGQLALAIGREAPVLLAPVEVRTERLPPVNGHETKEAESAGPEHEDAGVDVANEDVQLEEEQPLSGEECPPPAAVDGVVEELACGTAVPDLEQPDEDAAPEAKVTEAWAARQPSLPDLPETGGDASEDEATGVRSVFKVRCLGSFQVEVAGQEITGWTIQKARELLAYLVARGGSRVLREEAAEALWPEEFADHGRLLANAAYHLRRALRRASGFEGEVLTTMGQRYHLALGLFRTDIGAFEAHLGRAGALRGSHQALTEYERALALYRNDFLADEPFEWATAYREQYRRQFVEAAHVAARLAVDLRGSEKAMGIYRAILGRDPIDEEAARGLMHCYATLGDVNGVRKVYKVLTEALRRELEDENAEALPETTALLQELTEQR